MVKVDIYPPGQIPPNAKNRFSELIPSQSIAVIDKFKLESGIELKDVSVGFRTWGRLNETRDNAMVICHALTGSSDIEDWWGPLLGRGRSFDPTRYLIFCANVLGSPYGTSSPVTINPETGSRYGPGFPETLTRDDVRLHRIVLDTLKVQTVAAVIGGSMGGMAVLEWPLVHGRDYVRNIVPIATSARHSAWGISWGEAQRQSIWSDPDYGTGWYSVDGPGPHHGLAAARMAALLTYRSRDSFESRFGRREQGPGGRALPKTSSPLLSGPRTPAEREQEAKEAESAAASEKRGESLLTRAVNAVGALNPSELANGDSNSTTPSVADLPRPPQSPPLPLFSAQSYLRYQGNKFVSRFDANCYIHLSQKMDAHDVSRGRSHPNPLALAPAGSLVIAISTDGLFTLSEQKELADALPEAELVIVESPDGHDGFLLEFEQIDKHLLGFLHRRLPDIYAAPPNEDGVKDVDQGAIQKASLFGEAEGVTQW